MPTHTHVHVPTDLKLAISPVYRIRMGRSVDSLPSEDWAMRLHNVEVELVKLKKEYEDWLEAKATYRRKPQPS